MTEEPEAPVIEMSGTLSTGHACIECGDQCDPDALVCDDCANGVRG